MGCATECAHKSEASSYLLGGDPKELDGLDFIELNLVAKAQNAVDPILRQRADVRANGHATALHYV